MSSLLQEQIHLRGRATAKSEAVEKLLGTTQEAKHSSADANLANPGPQSASCIELGQKNNLVAAYTAATLKP